MFFQTCNIVKWTSVVIYLFLISNTEAEKSAQQDPPQNTPGRISYFQQLQHSADTRRNVRKIQQSQSLRNHVDNVLADFAGLRSLVDINIRRDSQFFQSELGEHPFGMLDDVLQGWTRISEQQDNQSQCVNDTGRIIVEFMGGNTSTWAKQMLDSIGKPGPSILEGRLNWVGNYKQCRSVRAPPDTENFSKGFSGAYTVVSIYLGSSANLLQPQAMFQWGICMPDTCDSLQVYSLLKESLDAVNLTSVTLGLPEIRSDAREVTTATVFSIVILSLIGALMIIGTSYDILVLQRPLWAAARENTPQRNGPASDGKYRKKSVETLQDEIYNRSWEEQKPLIAKPKEVSDTSTLAKVLVAFSVYTNTSKFLNTRQAPGSLGAIHGIRFLSMSWVVLGHTFVFGGAFFVNTIDELELLKRWTFDAVSNALPSVDTFFTLSGLLTAYLTVKEINKRGLKINWGLFYFHRFWRLTPPYMLAILLALGLTRFLGSGALWATTQPGDKSFCEDNWWTNLLYINNIAKHDEMCFGVSWYLANDMQFFILSPLMIIPFYFHKYAGLASCLFFLMVNWITTGVISTVGKMQPSFFAISKAADTSLNWGTDYYMVPWCRIGPYVVGLAVGGLMAKSELRMTRVKNIIGWVMATATGLAVVWGVHENINGHATSVGVAALYNAVSRSAWGACVCWVIVSCVSGYGGFVNSILSWSPFVSLGRLTYLSYLIHPTIISTYFGNMDQLFYVNDLNIIITYLGILVLVNMCAFVAMLALESPMIGLEKALLPQRRK